MPELYKGKIPIVRRSLNEGFLHGVQAVTGGAVPRDFKEQPLAVGDSPDGMKLINPSDYDAIYDEQEAKESSLEHIYLRGGKPGFEFLDQNGFPDCWCHSPAHAMMLKYLADGITPVPRINAVTMATMMKRTNGGWCGLGLQFLREKGGPLIGPDAPYQSRRYNDTPALRAQMAAHMALVSVYDLSKEVYDQDLTDQQLDTCLMENCPSPSDYNRAGHSMLSLRKVRYERGAWGRLTLNSWQGFGYFGLCVLDESWSPDGCVALRSSN